MDSNEVIVAMERGFAELRDEFGQRIDGLGQRIDGLGQRIDGLGQGIDGLGQRTDGRFDGLIARIDKLQLISEDMQDNIRQIAEGQTATADKLEKHLAEHNAEIEQRVTKLEFRVGSLEKRRRN